ncbi:hypothetical protein SAMN04488559_11816 [Isobaculum melis]|uniref:Uncharacterized protein n=2 Tax=Isobaculum melis TaxID=142588 RepID=A0A1H9TYU7_9LACT|nr:hypothetical protein SAMN04488559_11816 [Isobaculum melis]
MLSTEKRDDNMKRYVVKRVEIKDSEAQSQAFDLAKDLNCVVEIEDEPNKEISYPYWEELVQYRP